MAKIRIVILGSGNVATHLAKGLLRTGSCEIVQVYSRQIKNACQLASELGESVLSTNDLSSIIANADFYLIAVADAAVMEIAGLMPKVCGLVAHTSGSVPLSALSSVSKNTAVLYPLQTFTREAKVHLAEVPFFIEGSCDLALSEIDAIAHLLSAKIFFANSARRKILHIAGVLSCNFVNYLWDCTSQVLQSEGYEFSVVEPLIRATLDKAVSLGPHASQTGPAMRCDVNVIKEHMQMLDKRMSKLYREITQAIIETHHLNCKI